MANRFLNIQLDDSALQLSYKLRTRETKLKSALLEKMQWLMGELQKKAREGTTSSKVRDSIRDPQAEVDGAKVIGYLDWGGVDVQYMGGRQYDLALIQEKGARAHAINPLTQPGGKPTPRVHEKGGAKARFGTGAKFLKWGPESSPTFRKYAFRKEMLGKHFMKNAIDELREQFTRELRETTFDALE